VLQGDLDWPFAALVIPLVCVDYLLGALRFRLFFDGKALPRISLWNCMRSNWANFFMAAVTPFKTGAGPAQFYILWRSGAKVVDSVVVSMINFAASLVFFQIASMAAMYILPEETLFGNHMGNLMQGSFVVVFAVSAIVLFLLIFPRIALHLIEMLLRLIPVQLPSLQAIRDNVFNFLEKETDRFAATFALLRRSKKRAMVLTFLVTLVLYFNKYLIGYMIARALFQFIPFDIFIGLQIVNYFMVYFAPTPGASGIAELSSIWLMQKVMSPDILVLFALLWRFFTTILAAFIGGAVLLLDLQQRIARDLPSVKKGDSSVAT